MDIWPQYRLHTPAEILNRNHVSRYEVARDVIIQQIIQTFVGIVLGLTEPEDMKGKEDYDIARWAQRLRIAQRALPQLLGLLGLNAAAISKNVSGNHPMIAAVLAGGKYPSLDMGLDVVTGVSIPAFASWEVLTAKAIYWYLVPAIQFSLAIFIVDTWQYFLHRAMHINKWLYSKPQRTPIQTPYSNRRQQHSTPATTAYTSPTHSEPSTTTQLKDSSSTPLELA
jgi:sphinganine C4-monooxygenase